MGINGLKYHMLWPKSELSIWWKIDLITISENGVNQAIFQKIK